MTTQNSSVSCNLYTSTSKNIMISTCSSILILEQHSINQSDFEDKFIQFVASLGLQPGLGASTSVIHLSFPSDFRDNLWV